MQPSIVEHFEFVGNDEWHNVIGKTLLEHHQTSNTTVSVLKWVNALKALVQVYTTEVIGGFNDIVHIDALIGNTYGVSLKNIAGLVVCQTTALDMV